MAWTCATASFLIIETISDQLLVSNAKENDNEQGNNEEEQLQIKEAYKQQNAKQSRALHDENVLKIAMQPEQHKQMGDYVKSLIYGGLDGIITTFAIVTSVEGAQLSTSTMLVFGFANLIADGLAMGIGDYLSEMSEIEYIISEKEREKWEFSNYEEGEVQEMVQIYEQNGISKDDAMLMLRTMSKYKKFFIDHMMTMELQLKPPSGDEEPVKGGLVTLASFLLFGCVPLLSYVAFNGIEFDRSASIDPKFAISIVMTVLTLFGLGVLKGRLTESSMLKSGLFIAANGIFAAAAAYLIAFGLKSLYGA